VDLATELPNFTCAPALKLPPEMATVVPPPVGPLFGDTPVIVGDGSGDTFSVKFETDELDFASSTFAENENVPAVVGVPLMVPVPAFKCKPAGSAPAEVLQEYGVTPPVAVSVDEYPDPMAPAGTEAVVISSGPMNVKAFGNVPTWPSES
jgi:hypothetical protein